MKAKELAEKLMENPDAIVCVWDGEPNDVWVEITCITTVKNEYCDSDDGYQIRDLQTQLGFNI